MPTAKPRPNPAGTNSLSDAGLKIVNYIRAGYSGLYIVSPEEQRVEAELKAVMESLNRDHPGAEQFELCFWSVVEGLVNTSTKQVQNANDPLEVIQIISQKPDRAIVLLKDFHLFLEDPNPILVRKIKDVLMEAKTKQKTLIILGCRLVLPAELERELTVIEFALPGKATLRGILR